MSESRPQSASTLTVPVACDHSPKAELPVGCRAPLHVGPRRPTGVWCPCGSLLGARRTSTKNRFWSTNPVRHNTPKRAHCAGLGTGAARAAHTRRASNIGGSSSPAPVFRRRRRRRRCRRYSVCVRMLAISRSKDDRLTS